MAVLLVLLSGCGKTTVVENTSQKRATQIVIALYKQGISASSTRESGGQGKYRVEVDQQDYATALATIERNGLLDEPAPTFEELTASSSFFPPSREVEALRMDHALALEVKGLLEELSGVEHAEVLVRKRFGSHEDYAPSVSVVLRLQPGAAITESAVADVVRRAIPGIDAEKIFVSTEKNEDAASASQAQGVVNRDGSLSYVPLVPFVFKWRVPKDDYKGFAILFLFCIFLAGTLCLVFGYAVGQMRASRRYQSGENGDASGTNRIERQKRDLLEG